jgi:hypothetical protein
MTYWEMELQLHEFLDGTKWPASHTFRFLSTEKATDRKLDELQAQFENYRGEENKLGYVGSR